MKTSLVFLGILSAVYVANHGLSLPVTYRTEPGTSNTHPENVIEWKLSISGVDSQCTTSFTSHSETLVFSHDKIHCKNSFPGMEQLAKIRMQTNGDIVLYDNIGSKLVEFMESESTHHESYWPDRPLMTLARVD